MVGVRLTRAGAESPSLRVMTEWIAVHRRAAHRRVAGLDVWLAAVVATLLVLAGMGLLLATAAAWAWAPVGTLGP
jgi:polyferredoxin